MKGEINCAKNVTELKTPIVFAMCCLLAIASRQEELLTITIPPPDPTSNKPNDIEIILCSKKISKNEEQEENKKSKKDKVVKMENKDKKEKKTEKKAKKENKKENKEKKIKKDKPKRDLGKIATKVIAAILALMMILAVAGTLLYYIFVYY